MTDQRGLVDMFRQQMDIGADRTSEFMKLMEESGEFVDGQGRTISRANVDDWEWDARLRWRADTIADPLDQSSPQVPPRRNGVAQSVPW